MINVNVWEHTPKARDLIAAYMPNQVEQMQPGWYHVDPRNGQPVGPADTEETADILERAARARYNRQGIHMVAS